MNVEYAALVTQLHQLRRVLRENNIDVAALPPFAVSNAQRNRLFRSPKLPWIAKFRKAPSFRIYEFQFKVIPDGN